MMCEMCMKLDSSFSFSSWCENVITTLNKSPITIFPNNITNISYHASTKACFVNFKVKWNVSMERKR